MADIKFSEFPKATTSKDSDEIAILQDGVNKMIPSPVLESKMINKTVSRVIDQGGASLNIVNLKGVVPTYADLATITPTPELNDAYQVEADGLVYVYTESGFQSGGEGFFIPEPDLSGVPTLESVGIKKINAGQNVFSELVGSDLDDTSLWGVGYLNALGEVVNTTAGWRHTIKFYDLFEGSYPDGFIAIDGNARLIIYDADKNVIQSISNTSPYSITVNAIAGSRYVRTSWGTALHVGPINSDTSRIKLSPSSDIIEVTNEVFAMPDDVLKAKNEAVSEAIDEAEVLVDGIVEKLGFEVLPIGTNLISELSNSDPLDREIWGTGFLNENGTIGSPTSTAWIYSKPYIPIVKGDFEVTLIISGSARALIYNKDKEIIQAIANPGSGNGFTGNITAIEGAAYFRTSHAIGLQPSVASIKFTNKSIIYRGKTQDTSGVVVEGDSAPVNSIGIIGLYKDIIKASNPPLPKIPIVSFISDDGRVENDDWYTQVLDDKGIKSTFAIVTSWLDPLVTSAWNKERVMELHRQGHDIAGHTHTHPYTAELSDEEKEFQLQECKKRLLELGINPTMFVAPFGSVNLATDKIIRKYFDTDFVSGARERVAAGTCCNSAPLRRIRLTRVSFDMGQSGVSNLQHCKDAVDVAFAQNEWLVFAIHPQYAEYYPGNGNTFFQDRRDELGLLIDYIRSKEIAIMTARDAYEIWKNPVQLGDYLIDTKYYELGMDGSERGNFFE